MREWWCGNATHGGCVLRRLTRWAWLLHFIHDAVVQKLQIYGGHGCHWFCCRERNALRGPWMVQVRRGSVRRGARESVLQCWLWLFAAVAGEVQVRWWWICWRRGPWMVVGGFHGDGRRGGKLGLGFHVWDRGDDDVAMSNWSFLWVEDYDTCQHMVGLIWKVGIATWQYLVEWSLSDRRGAT